MVEVLGKPQEQQVDSIDEYLKKAEIIEERIRQITANEDWINEHDLNRKNAVKEAIISRDVAIEEKNLLEKKSNIWKKWFVRCKRLSLTCCKK